MRSTLLTNLHIAVPSCSISSKYNVIHTTNTVTPTVFTNKPALTGPGCTITVHALKHLFPEIRFSPISVNVFPFGILLNDSNSLPSSTNPGALDLKDQILNFEGSLTRYPERALVHKTV